MGKRALDFNAPSPAPVTIDVPTAPPQAAPPRQSEADVLAAQLGREEIAYQKAAETIFDRPQDSWSPGDWAILRRVGPRPGGTPAHDHNVWNEWIAKQTGRLSVVRQQQQAAGTPEQRESAWQLEEATAAKLATEGPTIERQIVELQAKLATLATEAKQAQDAVARREAAVASLCDESRLPEWVRDELGAASRRHGAEFRNELGTLRGRVHGLEGVQAIDPDSLDGQTAIRLHVEGNPRFPGDTFVKLGLFFDVRISADKGQASFGALNVVAWREYCGTLEIEAEKARQRIEELLPLERAAVEELARLRSHYVPR